MLGRDRGPGGKPVPGAHIQKTYDLVELGLAWRDNVELDPRFTDLERDVKAQFTSL
jgi:hypothetical protein